MNAPNMGKDALKAVVFAVLVLGAMVAVLWLVASVTGAGEVHVNEVDSDHIETIGTTAQEITVEFKDGESVDRVDVLIDGRHANHAHLQDGQQNVSIFMPWGNKFELQLLDNGTVVETVSGSK